MLEDVQLKFLFNGRYNDIKYFYELVLYIQCKMVLQNVGFNVNWHKIPSADISRWSQVILFMLYFNRDSNNSSIHLTVDQINFTHFQFNCQELQEFSS